MRKGSWLNPREFSPRCQRISTAPATWASTGQPLTPIVSGESAQPSTSSSLSW